MGKNPLAGAIVLPALNRSQVYDPLPTSPTMASQDYYNAAPEQRGDQQSYNMGPPQQGYDQPYNAPPPQGGSNQGYNQSDQYAQQPPQYQQSAPVGPSAGGNDFDKTFKIERPKFNDLWAGILLLLTFLGFVAVSGISLHNFSRHGSGGDIYHDANQFSLNSNTIILFAFVLVVAFVLSWAYLLAARAFTKQFIWITGILNIVFGFGTAIYYFYRHYYSSAVVFLLFSLFSVFCFITW
jgi:hypothetical protein